MRNKKEDYPQGQVTFLFTDLVDSTKLWEIFPEAMHEALARHDALLKEVVTAFQGWTVKTTGDGILAAFASPVDAVSAAIEGQKRMEVEEWRETGKNLPDTPSGFACTIPGASILGYDSQ